MTLTLRSGSEDTWAVRVITGVTVRISSFISMMTLLLLVACSGKKKEKAEPVAPKPVEQTVVETANDAPIEEDEVPPSDSDEALNEEDARELLVGIWRVNLDSVPDPEKQPDLAEEERAELIHKRVVLSGLAFEFAPDGRLTQFVGQQILQGKYSVTKAEKDRLTLSGKLNGRSTKMVVTVKAEKLLVEQDGQPAIHFVRGPPKIIAPSGP